MKPRGVRHESVADIPLNWEELDDLRQMVLRTFASPSSAQMLLRSVGYPREALRPWRAGIASEEWWESVFEMFERGVIGEPYRRLVVEAARRYPYNRVFRELLERHATAVEPQF